MSMLRGGADVLKSRDGVTLELHVYYASIQQGEQGPKGEKGDPGEPGALVSTHTLDTAHHSQSLLKTRNPCLSGSRSSPHWPLYILEELVNRI